MIPAHVKGAHVQKLIHNHKRFMFSHYISCGNRAIDEFIFQDLKENTFLSRQCCGRCGMNMLVIIRRTK